MQTTESNDQYLQVRSSKPNQFYVRGRPLTNGRFLVGSSENCDVVVQHHSVHAIHAILEIFGNNKKIYDLTGEGLLKINGQVKVVSEVQMNDSIQLGGAEIVLDKFYSPPESPTIVSTPKEDLSLEKNEILGPPNKEIDGKGESISSVETVKLPYLIYPFSSKFNFDQSEYIFEDSDQIYPIFKYEVNKSAVEIMILFQKKIVSVDYIPEIEGIYQLAGISQSEKNIEYAYLGAKEQVDFVDYRSGQFTVYRLEGYGVRCFSSSNISDADKILKLQKQDIIQFELGEISIVVRHVDSPPIVAKPDIFSRDKTLLWLWAASILLLCATATFFSLIEVKVEEVKKEKAPERIAKILYKAQPKVVKTASELQLPSDKVEKETKSTTPHPKNEPMISENDQIKKPVVKPQKGSPPPKKDVDAKSAQQQNSAKSPVKVSSSSPSPGSRGHVDVYKATGNFQSTVSTLVAKGGNSYGVRAEGFGTGTGTGTSAQGVKGTSDGITTATVSDKIGDISGTAKGVADFGYGTKGLAKGKQFYSASIPAETVVVGLMDPDIILKILREHIPQFRFCYQKEIESRKENIQGMVKLSFSIGASGNVTKAGVIEDSPLPSEIKKCVVNVLYGIQFPKLAAEGVVEVVQPFNFYPKI